MEAPATLTKAEVKQYWRDGFVVKKALLGELDIAKYHSRFMELVSGGIKSDPAFGMLVMKDVMVAKKHVKPKSSAHAVAKLQMIHRDPVFQEYIKHPSVVDVVQDLIGPDIMQIHNMLINKPPGIPDGRHPLHQDLMYFTLRPADRIVGTWTAMERVHRGNGCLCVIPGSHKGVLMDHAKPKWEFVNSAYWGIEDLPAGWKERRHYVELDAGDTLFFHPLLFHGSGRNRSDGFRRVISAHYCSSVGPTHFPLSPNCSMMFGELAADFARKLQKQGVGYALGGVLGAGAGAGVSSLLDATPATQAISAACGAAGGAAWLGRLPIDSVTMGNLFGGFVSRRQRANFMHVRGARGLSTC